VAAASECYDLSMAPNLASEQGRTAGSFGGRTVLSFESRRSAEIATLIENCGGRALVAAPPPQKTAGGPADR
jgi:hypothetical protein